MGRVFYCVGKGGPQRIKISAADSALQIENAVPLAIINVMEFKKERRLCRDH